MPKTDTESAIAVIKNDIGYIKESIKSIQDTFEKRYVTMDRYRPVERLVYLLVSIILTGLVGGAISFFLFMKH